MQSTGDISPFLPNKGVNSSFEELLTPPTVVVVEENVNIDIEQVEKEENEDKHKDVLHGINVFWALITPVAVTMILTVFLVTNYQSSALQKSMRSYLVFQQSDSKDSSSSTNNNSAVGESLVNAIVIIAVLAAMTFGLALLYKFNCIKILVGYILLASAAILGFNGGQLMQIILIDTWKWNLDWITLVYSMYNFSMVGVIAIFYQKGTSSLFQHIYLILVSVILAWQFSMWPEWTTWVFCVMFAVYDLCAVLTPCGPLKYLIGLIQEKQTPMPGLLYEAEIPNRTGNQTEIIELEYNSKNQDNKEEITSFNNLNTPESDILKSTRRQSELHLPATTKSELETQLVEFYEKYSPQDIYKAKNASELFFEKQSDLWFKIYHKYNVCSCAEGTPCDAALYEESIRQRKKVIQEEAPSTIKLGLGDFIFYSVLVGRAALFDFSTMAATFICIIMGLGGTLFLLSVLHKALPALPISIFLATIIYFLTRYLLVALVNANLYYPILL